MEKLLEDHYDVGRTSCRMLTRLQLDTARIVEHI